MSGPPNRPRLAWLFDIDGTLLVTDGAARESFARALLDRLGIEDDLADIAFAGRIEPMILADILRKHGVAFTDGDEARFWDRVFAHMRTALHESRGRLLPGVLDLLDAVASEPDWVSGLLTGNMTQMARIKLVRFGIEGRFRFGAFGEQACDRDELARLAVRRVESEFGIPARRVIVVGDTEHDIRCARAAGARVVAVATGIRSREDLESLRPDLVLGTLAERDTLLEWVRSVAAI